MNVLQDYIYAVTDNAYVEDCRDCLYDETPNDGLGFHEK